VYGICIRVASNYRDRAYRRREQPRDELPLQSSGASQERDVERQRTLLQLDEALSELLPGQREAFVLHAIEELDVKEIAEVQGVSKFTVYARLYAARKHLRACFGADPTAGRKPCARASATTPSCACRQRSARRASSGPIAMRSRACARAWRRRSARPRR
jgi:RNA polymerase sigma-70 factor (ECF subfamily)